MKESKIKFCNSPLSTKCTPQEIQNVSMAFKSKLIEQVSSIINIHEAFDLFAYQSLYSISLISVIDLDGAPFPQSSQVR